MYEYKYAHGQSKLAKFTLFSNTAHFSQPLNEYSI